MRVKIDHQWFSYEDHSLAIELSAEEWQQIVNAGPPAPYKWARFAAKCPKVIRTKAELDAWARDFGPNERAPN